MGAGSPSWNAAPAQPVAQLAMEAPVEFPEHWLVERGLYTTVGGDPGDRAAVKRLALHAEQAVPRIAEQLGLPTGRHVRIFLTHSAAQFQQLQPGRPEAWADATAWPLRAEIYLRAPRVRAGTARPLEQVLDHEITHVLVGQRFHGAQVPRWLHEGLAQVVAKEYSAETTSAISRGMLGDNLLSLDDLVAGFPHDPLRAHLAYAQSADLVAFIRNTYGEESLRVLVRELAGGRPVRAAFREATGEGLDEVDQAWRSRLESSKLWFPSLVGDGAWWGLGGVLLLLGYLRVRRRNRERRAALEREDALQRRLEEAWLREQRVPELPPEPPWAHPVAGDWPSRDPRDGWSAGPPQGPLRGWISDEDLEDGLLADEEGDPLSTRRD